MSDSPEPRQRVVIYTDGGADPNPGPGGWGVVLLHPGSGKRKELSGGEPQTTNNRMELTAAIRALESLTQPCQVQLFTDSQYLRKGITQWLPGWVAKGWKRKGGEVKNQDLWRSLDEARRRHEVDWRWVKGHAGHEYNERADRLASAATRAQKQALRPTGTTAAGGRSAEPEVDAAVFLKVSCHGGRGAWAALVRDAAQEMGGDSEAVRSGKAPAASANHLEIRAAAEILETLPKGQSVAFHTVSDYLRNGASQWLAGWRGRGWKNSAGEPVKHARDWQRLEAALAGRRVIWPGVKSADKLPELEHLAKLTRAALKE